jgi:hypothetical protein
MTPRKHPSAAFWATAVVLVVLAAYPPSFGPACCLSPSAGEWLFYRPCAMLVEAPEPVSTPMRWWIRVCGGETALLWMDMDHIWATWPPRSRGPMRK